MTQLANEVIVDGGSYLLIWTGNMTNYFMDHFSMSTGTEVQFYAGS